MKLGHIILDRDGVLNREADEGWIVAPEQWIWESGAREGLALLCEHGMQISVVTNQSCIGRGVSTAIAVEALHAWMIAEIRLHRARIDRVFVCPHVDRDGCGCRKPKAGLCEQAVETSGVGRERTLMIGDSRRDLEAGRTAGLRTALVRSGKGRRQEPLCRELADWIFDDLHHAAQCVVGIRDLPLR